MYKLKNNNGRVNFLLKTGKDYVKNAMAVSAAQHIIDAGNMVASDKEGYPICVDKKWYFEGEEMNPVITSDEVKAVKPATRKRGK